MMPFVNRAFTRYVVYYLSGSSPAIGVPQDAEIDCFNDKDERVGMIYFFPEDVALPANHDTGRRGIHLHYRTSRFADIMTMLKEEKPLHISFDTTNKSGWVGTGPEPVGEQEGA